MFEGPTAFLFAHLREETFEQIVNVVCERSTVIINYKLPEIRTKMQVIMLP